LIWLEALIEKRSRVELFANYATLKVWNTFPFTLDVSPRDDVECFELDVGFEVIIFPLTCSLRASLSTKPVK
jgi:hypothetical protein